MQLGSVGLSPVKQAERSNGADGGLTWHHHDMLAVAVLVFAKELEMAKRLEAPSLCILLQASSREVMKSLFRRNMTC